MFTQKLDPLYSTCLSSVCLGSVINTFFFIYNILCVVKENLGGSLLFGWNVCRLNLQKTGFPFSFDVSIKNVHSEFLLFPPIYICVFQDLVYGSWKTKGQKIHINSSLWHWCDASLDYYLPLQGLHEASSTGKDRLTVVLAMERTDFSSGTGKCEIRVCGL